MRSNQPFYSNARVQPEYGQAIDALKEVLRNLPPVVISIDGAPNVGKTTLGRFLAWTFNVSLIETDLYLIPGLDRYEYERACLKRVVLSRINRDRPVIVEGVVSLRELEALHIESRFHIHVRNADAQPPRFEDWELYVKEFQPQRRADLELEMTPTTNM